MRTSHRQIRKRILDAKSKISDEEFFSSRAYNGYLTDLAEAATKRYKRPLRVRVVADHDDDIQRFRRLACRSFCLRCRNVAEHQLGQLVSFAIPPDLHDVLHTLIDLCSGFVRQHLVDDPLVKPQLAAIRGNLEHIVLGWVNGSAVYQRCALRKGLDHFLLMFGRLRHDVVVFLSLIHI